MSDPKDMTAEKPSATPTDTGVAADSAPVSALRRARFRLAIDVVCVLVAAIAGFAGFAAAGRSAVDVGPTTFSARVAFGTSGLTVIQVPPLGSVDAHTHAGPAQLVLALRQVDVTGVRELLTTRSLSSATRVRGVGRAAGWVLGLGALGALVAAAAVPLLARRSWRVVVVSAVLGVALPLAAVGVGYATYDRAAMREPHMTGALAYVPGLTDAVASRVASIEKLRDQANTVAADLQAYYADKRELVSGGDLDNTYRVLHVTDLHLDPVGGQLEQRLARSYDASLVIDTGDLPILGSTVESGAYASLIGTSTPRIYVPGNHDSPASIAAIAQVPGVTVVASSSVEVDGLRIYGVADPISRTFGVEPDRSLVVSEGVSAYRALRARMRSGEPTPDIVAIHNPAMEGRFVGLVPLILSGHTHNARLYTSKGTVRLNSGTAGGTPYAPGTTGHETVPYTASVLYYTGSLPRRLIAVDRISISTKGQTSVTRDVIDPTLLP